MTFIYRISRFWETKSGNNGLKSHCLLQDIIEKHLPGQAKENHKTAGNPARIQTKYPHNTSPGPYHYTRKLDDPILELTYFPKKEGCPDMKVNLKYGYNAVSHYKSYF